MAAILEIKTIDIIRQDYPGQAVLTTDQVAKVLGKNGTAGPQTIRNQIAAGTFPLADKLRKVSGRHVLPIAALADWLDGAQDAPPVKANEAPKRGRPRKIVTDWLAEFEDAWRGLYEAERTDLSDDPRILGGTGKMDDGRL